MNYTTTTLLTTLLLSFSHSLVTPQINTILPDTTFTQQEPFYLKIKQGDSKSIDLKQITDNWNQAFDFAGTYPQFCKKEQGALFARQQELIVELQDKADSDIIENIAVNNKNGIIFTFIKSKGLYSLKFNSTSQAFQPFVHVSEQTLNQSVKASKIINRNGNQDSLVVITSKAFVLFCLDKDDSKPTFEYSNDTTLFTESQMKEMVNVKIISYGSDIVFFNVNSSIVLINLVTKKSKRFDFKEKIRDMSLILANGRAELLLLIENSGLFMSNFFKIEQAFDSNTNFFPNTTKPLTPDQSAKLGTKLLQIKTNGQRLIAIIQQVGPQQNTRPFYLEYYINQNFNFKQVSTGYYAKYSLGQDQAKTLLVSKNYSLVWLDDIGYVFPLNIGIKDQHIQTYTSTNFNVFTIYQPPNSQVTYLLGEHTKGILLERIQYQPPILNCDLQDQDDRDLQGGQRNLQKGGRGKGKYNFELKVYGKTCESQKEKTVDPFVICERNYNLRIRVIDDDQSSYKKVLLIVFIILGILLIVGIIFLIILVLRCRKQRRLARNYATLSRRREFQVLNDNNQEEVEMGNIGIFDGFERAAIRDYDDDDKNGQINPVPPIQQQQQLRKVNEERFQNMMTEEEEQENPQQLN